MLAKVKEASNIMINNIIEFASTISASWLFEESSITNPSIRVPSLILKLSQSHGEKFVLVSIFVGSHARSTEVKVTDTTMEYLLSRDVVQF